MEKDSSLHIKFDDKYLRHILHTITLKHTFSNNQSDFNRSLFLFLPLIIHIYHSSHCEKKSSNCAFIVHNMFIFVYVKQTKTGNYDDSNIK